MWAALSILERLGLAVVVVTLVVVEGIALRGRIRFDRESIERDVETLRAKPRPPLFVSRDGFVSADGYQARETTLSPEQELERLDETRGEQYE